MKKIILAAAFSLLATSAFAQATLSMKDNGTNSNGSSIGQQSSQATGNGDWVGGNGTSGGDQTTSPGSRADAVHTSNTDKPGQHNK
jgi:hypothetical protein